MAAATHIDSAPMSEINTTPLIDVMLVLLIMVIITMPMQSHVVKVDLPSGPVIKPNPLKNKIVITQAGEILWNGAAVNMAQVASALAETQRMPQPPELQIQPDPGARYALVDEVLALSKRTHVERMGFVGNESYRTF